MTDTQTSSSISWTIAVGKNTTRSGGFYVIALVLMALLLLFAVWQKNFLFGIFVILASGTLMFLSHSTAQEYSFALTDEGLIVGDAESVHRYEKFSHFDIHVFSDEDIELLLAPRQRLKPIMRVPLFADDIEEITSFLKNHLSHKEIEFPFLDLLAKRLGM